MAVAPERFSLKDHLFNRETISRLGGLLAPVIPRLIEDRFVAEVMAGIGSLELKQRVTHIARILDQYLPEDFEQSIELIRAAPPPPLDPNLSDGDFGDFIFAPYPGIHRLTVQVNGRAAAATEFDLVS